MQITPPLTGVIIENFPIDVKMHYLYVARVKRSVTRDPIPKCSRVTLRSTRATYFIFNKYKAS